MLSDAELVRRIGAGDRAALATLYERYLPALWRYVCARLPEESDRRDIVSETFLAAMTSIDRFDATAGSVVAWLTGIARHKLADRRRRASRTTGAVAGTPYHNGLTPIETAVRAETRQIVAQVMDRLNDDQRLVLEWKYIERLSVRDVARRLDRTEKAIEALLYRARAAFREIYADLDDSAVRERQGRGEGKVKGEQPNNRQVRLGDPPFAELEPER